MCSAITGQSAYEDRANFSLLNRRVLLSRDVYMSDKGDTAQICKPDCQTSSVIYPLSQFSHQATLEQDTRSIPNVASSRVCHRSFFTPLALFLHTTLYHFSYFRRSILLLDPCKIFTGCTRILCLIYDMVRHYDPLHPYIHSLKKATKQNDTCFITSYRISIYPSNKF